MLQEQSKNKLPVRRANSPVGFIVCCKCGSSRKSLRKVDTRKDINGETLYLCFDDYEFRNEMPIGVTSHKRFEYEEEVKQ